jgi:ribose transport system permease protein
MTVLTGAAYIVQSGTQINITDQKFLNVIAGTTLGVSNLIIIFLVVTIICAIVAQYTAFGRQLYAIGGNAEAARLSGIAVRRNLLVAYAFSGLMAGLAGIMIAAELQQGSSLVGGGDELAAIAAAVVGGASLFGGTGSPITSVAGGFVIGIITNIMTLRGIASQPQLVIQGLVILIAVYLTSGDGPRAMSTLGGLARRSVRRGRPQEPNAEEAYVRIPRDAAPPGPEDR